MVATAASSSGASQQHPIHGDEAYVGEDDDDDEDEFGTNGGPSANPLASAPTGGQPKFERGMDAGLAKCAPNSDDLSAEHYRNWRRRLELFERMCKKRGPLVISEGALMVLQNLRGQAWDACEMCDMDRLDTRWIGNH